MLGESTAVAGIACLAAKTVRKRRNDMKNLNRRLASILLAISTLMSFGRVEAQPIPILPALPTYIYPVKFVCGLWITPTDISKLPAEYPVKPANYATSINILNYSPDRTCISYKAVISAFTGAGAISPFLGVAMGPDGALEVDCTTIANQFTSPPKDAFIEGFVEIQSPTPLGVTAVYTSQTCNNPGANGSPCSSFGDVSLEVVPQSFSLGRKTSTATCAAQTPPPGSTVP
jgi:hypothetical protein